MICRIEKLWAVGAFERNQSDAMTFILDAELIYHVQFQKSKSHGITCQMTPPPNYADQSEKLIYRPPFFPPLARRGNREVEVSWN
jgi:hypothetical protein